MSISYAKKNSKFSSRSSDGSKTKDNQSNGFCGIKNFAFASGFCRLKSKYNFSRLYKSRASESFSNKNFIFDLPCLIASLFIGVFASFIVSKTNSFFSSVKKFVITVLAFCLLSGSFSLAHSSSLPLCGSLASHHCIANG